MMLDKGAFEKALQQDKQSAPNNSQQPKNNMQFNNPSQPSAQNNNISKREQLWQERKMK